MYVCIMYYVLCRAHEELGGRDGVLAATKNTVDTK